MLRSSGVRIDERVVAPHIPRLDHSGVGHALEQCPRLLQSPTLAACIDGRVDGHRIGTDARGLGGSGGFNTGRR